MQLSAVQFLREGVNDAPIATEGVGSTASVASAPAVSLNENTAPETANPTTPTAATETDASAAAQEAANADEPIGVRNLRGQIKNLETQLAELKPYAKPIQDRFAKPDEFRPVVGLVDAARNQDPAKIGDELFELIGEQNYTRLYEDMYRRHGALSGASTDDSESPESEDFDAEYESEEAAAIAQELRAARAKLNQYEQRELQAAEQAQIAQQQMREQQTAQAIKAPLDAVLQTLNLGEATAQVSKVIQAQVMFEFEQDPANVERVERVMRLAQAGEPQHLYSGDVELLRQTMAELAERASNYHVKAYGLLQHPQAVAAAALTNQQARNPTSVAGATPVVSASNPPAQPPAAPAYRSEKSKIFDRKAIGAEVAEMKASGRI